MKKLICLLTSLAGIAAFSGVQADDNFYAGVFGGANWIQNSGHHGSGHSGHNRTGYLVGADVGYKWCNGIRTELEFAYRDNQRRDHNGSGCGHSNRHNHSYAGLFNVLYDFDAWGCWCVKPYLGAGIGVGYDKRHNGSHHHDYGFGSYSSHHSHNSKTNFAWQLIAGLLYPLNDCVDLSLSYRFFRIERNHRGHDSNKDNNNHGLALGVNYNF